MRRLWPRPGLAAQGSGLVLVLSGAAIGCVVAYPERPLIAIAAAALSAVAVAVWIRWRVVGPIESVVRSATAFAAGDPRARAPEQSVAGEHERLARAVNRALEHVSRTREMRAELDKAATRAAVESIEALGQGQLHAPTPALREPFEPVARAISRARVGLIERTRALHESSVAVVEQATEIHADLRSMAEAAQGQHAAVARLAEGAGEAEAAIAELQPDLGSAVESVFLYGAEQRRLAHDVRDQVLELSRHAGDASDAAERVRALLVDESKLEQILELLVQRADGSGSEGSCSVLVGEARAAQSKLRRELGLLGEDLRRLSGSIDRVCRIRPASVADLDLRVTEPLAGLAQVLVRSLELTAASMKGLSREAAKMNEVAVHGREAVARLRAELPRLATAVAGVQIDETFADSLLHALHEARRDAEQLDSDGLSPSGAAMLAEVRAAADAARVRLAGLVRATEAAMTVLRVG